MEMTWAVFNPVGNLVYIGLHRNKSDVWDIYLGWPTQEEIDDKKRQGFVVEMVMIIRDEKML